MSIEGVNSSSLPLVSSTIAGGAQSLPENSAVPNDFSNALTGQIELLTEGNGRGELPSITMSKTINDSLAQKDGEEGLTALLNTYLPQSYKKNEDVDLEATLLSLTDALKSITPSITTDGAMATTQSMSNVMALNVLSFVKPLLEEAKLNMPGKEDLISGNFLQKDTTLHQSIQDKQGFNLPSLENTDPSEKALIINKPSSLSGIEQAASGVVVDISTIHRPVDNRTDSAAITRPLTHPDWNKDLGEQIIWMNNKAISAAEIKLNPVHLGPISVRIDVNQDQAAIMFTAQHAEVKDAIEASIPKLREMLGSQQLNLVNVNISQNSTPDKGQSQSQSFSRTPENNEQGIQDVTGILQKVEHEVVVVNKGLLSLYV